MCTTHSTGAHTHTKTHKREETSSTRSISRAQEDWRQDAPGAGLLRVTTERGLNGWTWKQGSGMEERAGEEGNKESEASHRGSLRQALGRVIQIQAHRSWEFLRPTVQPKRRSLLCKDRRGATFPKVV
eukprot:GGOE01009021.1.p1 GENE.GGOE01009021.1~~GGOE01009021.1.p1  ORF type:complete len:128 (+),score=7.58 GGOE01009021.1:319-702(+)